MMLDAGIQKEVIQSLSKKLRAVYIFPEIAEQICDRLQQHLENGEYVGIDEGDFFAYALTLHLQEINHDEHLWVRYHAQSLPEDECVLRLNPEWQAARMLEARLDNHGFYKMERLPGNVGYVDIHYFHRPAWGGDTAAAAMAFLANGNALIIDLRSCKGGFPGMIALLCSYLFKEEPQHLASVYWRDEDITQQYWTMPYIPGKRLTDTPVYVLTSKVTYSGGEAFAYILQNRKRAVIIGEKTDGGAHAGASYRLHPNFEAFIPVGRTFDPLTNANWEGCGITPDITTPPEEAFPTAYRAALQNVLDQIGEPPQGPLADLKKEAQAAFQNLEINR